MILYVHQPRLCRSVSVCGILKFALTACVANRAVKRVILQNKLQHGLPALSDRWAVCCDEHAFRHDCCTRSLQLWRPGDLYKTHAAGALEREAWVIAERRDLNSSEEHTSELQSPCN